MNSTDYSSDSLSSSEMTKVWQKTLVLVFVALAGITLFHHETAIRAVELWSSSSAYNYAFLIIPISAYLVWEDKGRVLTEKPKASILGILALFAFATAWMVADAVGINEGRQLSLVGLYQAALLAILGVRIFRILLFPFAYLWLLVPTGEFLVPTLQDIATVGTVWMLQISNIPTYVEGYLIQVPAGNFLVEPGCSGLNFILSSLALSLLYGKLTYRRWRTRLVCIGVAILASVLGNIARIYLIIALTQVTDRQLNIADDHILYGWGFFAVIMLVMMWFGLKFEDKDGAQVTAKPTAPHVSKPALVSTPVATVIAICIAVAPLAVRASFAPDRDRFTVEVSLPQTIGNWQRSVTSPNWAPSVVDGVSKDLARYEQAGQMIDLFIAYFPYQTDSFEPKAFTNRPADPDLWNTVVSRNTRIRIDGQDVTANYFVLRGGLGYRQVMTISISGTCVTNSRLVSRLCGAPGRYGLAEPSGSYIAFSVEGQEEDVAVAAISDLMRETNLLNLASAAVRSGSLQSQD